jgi:hypothetical protein
MSDHIPTFADICSAIAEGHLTASNDGSMYHVNALELRRYLDKLQSLPTISQSPISHPESVRWSSSPNPSVA